MAAKRRGDPNVSTLSPIQKLILDALHDSKKAVVESLKKLGKLKREQLKSHPNQNMKTLFEYSDKQLGEFTLEQCRQADSPIWLAALDAAWDEGYRQACEDNATVTEAYLKGLN